MIVYVSFEVRMSDLWLPDGADQIEALRQGLLEHAKSRHASRVKPGASPAEDAVQVEPVESIGGLYNEPPAGAVEPRSLG
jgi:hypothetical protein